MNERDLQGYGKGYKSAAEVALVLDGHRGARVEQHGGIAVSVYEIAGKPIAAVYRGKKLAAVKRYSFRSEESRAAWVAEQIAAEQQRGAHKEAAKEAKQAAAAAFVMPYKVGDVLHGSWGYDQTNAEFFEVVGIVGKRMIEIRALIQNSVPGSGGSHGMSENVVPAEGAGRFYEAAEGASGYHKEKAAVLRKLVSVNGYVRAGHCGLSKWNGRPVYSSWYA